MQTLLNLLAAIALLVWGTHIVRSGVLRVYGTSLRQVLRRSVGNRGTSFVAGVGVTGMLQSSTATALLASSFVSQGMITTSAALAVMLGADVGTALMVQFFSLNLAWLAPLLIVSGVVVYLSKKNERAGQIGKIVLGLGVIILALQMVTAATAPLTQAAGVRVLFAQLSGDLLLDVLIGALLVVVSYSSLAVVLLVATLSATHVVPIEVALPIVLGANLGGGLLALLTTWKADAIARRVPLGNFLFKAAGVAAAVMALPLVTPYLIKLQDDPQQLVVQFHLLFNIVLAIGFIRFTERFASITERWLPAPRPTDAVGQPKYLDPVALDTPGLALGNAAREAIRLADTVHEVLTGLLTVLKTNDLSLVEALRRKDDEIDRIYSAIKRYLAQVSREALEANEARRWTEIIQFTINLEHIGDIVERLLLDIAQRKIQHKLSFSGAGMSEIGDLHARLTSNLQLAVAVFLNGDLKSAQQLIAEKVTFRELELSYADRHLHRLFENKQQSVETSSLHLDLLSDFKRINSLICSVSYPILESAGLLAKTRVMGAQPSLFNTKGPATNEVR
jgi:phosphate:Na+ symporter